MSQRMGRNPFEKRKAKSAQSAPAEQPLEGELIDLPDDDDSEAHARPGLLNRLLIELPAEAYVLSLKARMLTRNLFK